MPEEYVKLHAAPGMRLIARTSMVDVESGKALRSRRVDESDAQVETILARRLGDRLRGSSADDRRSAGRRLLDSVKRGSYLEFVSTLREAGWLAAEVSVEELWTEFVDLAVGGNWVTANFDLPDDRVFTSIGVPTAGGSGTEQSRPVEPTALILDDTESASIVSLGGVRLLAPTDAVAILTIRDSAELKRAKLRISESSHLTEAQKSEKIDAYDKEFDGLEAVKLSSSSIAVGPDGNLRIKFPSLRAWGIEDSKTMKRLPFSSLKVYVRPTPWQAADATELVVSTSFIRYLPKTTKKRAGDPGFKMDVTAAQVAGSKDIVPGKPEGALDVFVDVSKTKKGERDLGPVVLSLNGPDWRLAAVEPAGGAVAVAGKNQLHISKSCRITLELYNLANQKKIVLKGKHKNAKDAHADIDVPVVLRAK